MYLMGLGKPTHVTALNEELAVALGADILGESIVFGIAALTVFLEYSRQAVKSKAKEEDLLGRLTDMENKLDFLITQNKTQETKIKDLLEFRASYSVLQQRNATKQTTARPPVSTSGRTDDGAKKSAKSAVVNPAAAANRSQQPATVPANPTNTTFSDAVGRAAEEVASKLTGTP